MPEWVLQGHFDDSGVTSPTGDSSCVVIVFLSMLVCVFGILVLVGLRKKRSSAQQLACECSRLVNEAVDIHRLRSSGMFRFEWHAIAGCSQTEGKHAKNCEDRCIAPSMEKESKKESNAMKVKKFVVSLLCLTMLIGLLPAIAFAATTIDTVNILVTHPVHLASPETYVEIYGNCQLDTTYRDQGHSYGLRWKNVATGEYLDGGSTFVGGQAYELSIMLLHLNGYAFSAAETSITINTDPATVFVIDETHAQATLTFTAANLYINTVNIENIDAPVAGNKPDFSATVQEDTCNIYSAGTSGGVTWYDLDRQEYLSENDTFEAGHRYSVGIYVQAKQGYEFPQNALAIVNGKAYNTTIQNDGKILKVALEYPALAETHTHTPSAWRITGAYHYKACTTCGDFLEQEDHTGGKATCAEKGKCAVCGYEYIDVNENHEPDTSKWTACGDLYHAHLCKKCGAHCDVQAHTAGTAGSPDAAVVCKDCGYIMAPAKAHTHNLTRVKKKNATCTKPGNVEYYTCDGCSDLFADSAGKTKITDTVIAPLGHQASEDWKQDEDNHWRICTVCKKVLSETKMSHEMNGEKCTACGFIAAVPTTVPETEPVTEPNATTETAEPETDATGPVTSDPTQDPADETSDPTGCSTDPTDDTAKPSDPEGTEVPTVDGNADQKDDGGKNRGASVWIILGIVAALAAGVVLTVVIIKRRTENKNG